MCVWQWCSEEITKYISDNLPYAYCEQIGKEIRDISDEIPFEIPDSWEWVRLGSIVYNRGQMKPTSDFCYVDIGSIDNKRQRLGDTENIITPDKAPSLANKIIDVGDIIYSTVRPYLHNMCIIDKQFSLQPIASTGFATMTCYSGLLNKYLFYYLLAPDFDNYANDTENSKGVAYPAINDDRLYKALIPLPPLSEQHRIVAKIEELLPYIERYGKAEEHITALNTTFPEALKKSILQEAVQGKLVPQNPDDEPASVLLERIRAEKQALIKTGKIKKDKHESAIITRDKIPYEIIDGKERCIADEVPFEIPDSWCWCRLGSIIQIESGKGLTSKQMIEGSIPVYGGNGITGYHNASLVHKETVVIGRVGYYCGSVHITEKEAWVTDNAFITTYPENSIYREYLVYTLRYMNLGQNNNATAQPVVSGKKIYPMLFPLPPLAEQHRIVAKIEEIMPMIERLTLR